MLRLGVQPSGEWEEAEAPVRWSLESLPKVALRQLLATGGAANRGPARTNGRGGALWEL